MSLARHTLFHSLDDVWSAMILLASRNDVIIFLESSSRRSIVSI